MINRIMDLSPFPEQQLTCPVCGSTNIQPSNRQSMNPTDDGDNAITGILGYRCENGHVSIAAGLHLS